MDSIFKEINERTKAIQELEEALGMKKEDIPQEILDEIFGATPFDDADRDKTQAGGRSAEADWVSDLKGQQAAQTSYHGREGGPRPLPAAPPGDSPQAGDFVKVGNQMLKVREVKDQFGETFVYFEHTGEGPPPKAIMANHLKLDKEVAGKKVYTATA